MNNISSKKSYFFSSRNSTNFVSGRNMMFNFSFFIPLIIFGWRKHFQIFFSKIVRKFTIVINEIPSKICLNVFFIRNSKAIFQVIAILNGNGRCSRWKPTWRSLTKFKFWKTLNGLAFLVEHILLKSVERIIEDS